MLSKPDDPLRPLTAHEGARRDSAAHLAVEIASIYGVVPSDAQARHAADRILSTMKFCERARVLLDAEARN